MKRSTLFNSVDPRCVRFDVHNAARMALAKADLSEKAAAADMEIDRGTFSRQLNGREHLALDLLVELPVDFWEEFLPMLAAPFGMEVRRATHRDVTKRRAIAAFEALMEALGSEGQ